MALLNGISLIFISLGLLVVPGILYNNLNNTGLAPAQTLTCPGYPDVTCQGSVSAGCQSNSAFCTLSGQTVSFFNVNSPFTSLLTGNLLGFFSALFPVGGQQTIYTAQPQFPLPVGVGASNADAHGDAYCKTLPANQNVIPNPLNTWILDCSLKGSTYPASSYSWFFGSSPCCGAAHIELVQAPGTVGSPVVNDTAFFVSLTTAAAPTLPNGATGYYVYGFKLLSTSFNASAPYHFGAYLYGWTQTSAGANPLGWLSVLGFLVGIAVLVFLALGVGFESGALTFNFGISNNRQGTKFAQVLLIGLVVWTPLYSEFATWFTTGILPYGLDGAAGIVSLVLTGLFWFGIYTQATSD